MKLAPALGIPFSEFWDMSIFEFMLVYKNHIRNKQEEWDEKVTVAYVNAYFQRINKLSNKVLAEFLTEGLKKKQKPPQTAETMLDVIKRLNAQFGGNEQ